MSRRRKRRQSQKSNSPSSQKGKGLLISLGILVSVLLVVLIFMNSGRGSSQPADSEVAAANVASPSPLASPSPSPLASPSPLPSPPQNGPPSIPPNTGGEVGEGMARLGVRERVIGRWLRTDGEYFIEITEVHDDGKLDAGYYNPYPINVAEAKVLPEAEVFMKLEDENYPGSTYTLNYDPENDTLTGIYFHAGLQQEFEVVFYRLEMNE